MHVLPDSITDDQGALLELLSVAVHAVPRSGMAAGDSASIVGAGPIGLVTLAAARAASAGEIFIVERATAGKDKARTGDAHHVIDPADGDPVQQIQALTPGGLGVDVACECVGHAVTLNVALEAIRKGGTAAIVGVFEQPSSVHFNDLVLSERTMVGVLGYVDDSPCAIALLADGRINADPLITSRVALDDAIEDGFRELVRNKDEHVKILINPSGVGSKPSTRAAAEPAVKVQQQLTSVGFDRRAPEPRHAIEPGRAQRRAREPRRSARSSTSRELPAARASPRTQST